VGIQLSHTSKVTVLNIKALPVIIYSLLTKEKGILSTRTRVHINWWESKFIWNVLPIVIVATCVMLAGFTP